MTTPEHVNCRCLPAPKPATFANGQVPVYFMAGPLCGDIASSWEQDLIAVQSSAKQGRIHVYQRTGVVLPTEPPARVYEHHKIIDGVA